jgi:hypothetical protein
MPLSVQDGLFSHPKAMVSTEASVMGLLLTDCRTARLLMHIEGDGLGLLGEARRSRYL